MIHHSLSKRAVLLGAGVSLWAATLLGSAVAHADARLDQAAVHVAKAIALLEAAQDPKKDPGLHRKKALVFLKHAATQIHRANADKVDAAPKPVAVAKAPKKTDKSK